MEQQDERDMGGSGSEEEQDDARDRNYDPDEDDSDDEASHRAAWKVSTRNGTIGDGGAAADVDKTIAIKLAEQKEQKEILKELRAAGVLRDLQEGFTSAKFVYRKLVEEKAQNNYSNINYTTTNEICTVPYGIPIEYTGIKRAIGKIIVVTFARDGAAALMTQKHPTKSAIFAALSERIGENICGEVIADSGRGKIAVKAREASFVIMDIAEVDVPDAPRTTDLIVFPFDGDVIQYMHSDSFQYMYGTQFADWHEQGVFNIKIFWANVMKLTRKTCFQMTVPGINGTVQNTRHTGHMLTVSEQIFLKHIAFEVRYPKMTMKRTEILQQLNTERSVKGSTDSKYVMDTVYLLKPKKKDARDLLLQVIERYKGAVAGLKPEAKLVVMHGAKALEELASTQRKELTSQMFLETVNRIARKCSDDNGTVIVTTRVPTNWFLECVRVHLTHSYARQRMIGPDHAERMLDDIYRDLVSSYFKSALSVYTHIFGSEFDAYAHKDFVEGWNVPKVMAILDHFEAYDIIFDPSTDEDEKNGEKYFRLLRDSGYSAHVNMSTFPFCVAGHESLVRKFYKDNSLMPPAGSPALVMEASGMEWIVRETATLTEEQEIALETLINGPTTGDETLPDQPEQSLEQPEQPVHVEQTSEQPKQPEQTSEHREPSETDSPCTLRKSPRFLHSHDKYRIKPIQIVIPYNTKSANYQKTTRPSKMPRKSERQATAKRIAAAKALVGLATGSAGATTDEDSEVTKATKALYALAAKARRSTSRKARNKRRRISTSEDESV